jgi:transcriptional antiterminator NusG
MTADMTDETTETANDEMTDNETIEATEAENDNDVDTSAPADLLPTGDTDVLAEAAEEDDDGSVDGNDVAEEVDAVQQIDDVADDADEDAEVEVDGAEGAEVEPEPFDDPTMRPGQWYVVHTQSGYEKKVTANLQARIQSMNMEDSIFEIVIPMEEVDEFKNGKKQTVQRKVFPGYLLVRCKRDDDTWYCVRNTPGITGFVGQSRHGQKPTPLSRREVKTFLSPKTEGADAAPRR